MQTFFKNIVLVQTLHCYGGTFSQKCDKLDLYISPSSPPEYDWSPRPII